MTISTHVFVESVDMGTLGTNWFLSQEVLGDDTSGSI